MNRVSAFAFVLLLAGCATVRFDLTKGVSNICPIHHRAMEKRRVEVIYGFMYSGPNPAQMRDNYERAKAASFPFGEEVFATSAERADVLPIDYARVYVCDECVKGLHKWRYGE